MVEVVSHRLRWTCWACGRARTYLVEDGGEVSTMCVCGMQVVLAETADCWTEFIPRKGPLTFAEQEGRLEDDRPFSGTSSESAADARDGARGDA